MVRRVPFGELFDYLSVLYTDPTRPIVSCASYFYHCVCDTSSPPSATFDKRPGSSSNFDAPEIVESMPSINSDIYHVSTKLFPRCHACYNYGYPSGDIVYILKHNDLSFAICWLLCASMGLVSVGTWRG